MSDRRETIALNTMRWRCDSDQGDWPEAQARDLLEYIGSPHRGDCTNMPMTCLRCEAEAAYRQADQLLLALG